MKELATILMETAFDTGYEYGFLAEQVEEAVKDGSSYTEAVKDICAIAYEYDF